MVTLSGGEVSERNDDNGPTRSREEWMLLLAPVIIQFLGDVIQAMLQ